MQNGDLSNALTKRVLVVVDTIREESLEMKKVLGLIPTVKKTYSYNRALVSRFYLFADKSSVTLELVAYDMNDKDLGELVEYLDEVGTNPFRYYTAYDSVDRLVAELPYRPEVAGVIDLPQRLLRYGSWGLDFSRV